MKYLRHKKSIVNLANVIDIYLSGQYIMLATIDGREVRYVFGTPSTNEMIFEQILEFLASDEKVFEID